MLSPEEKAILEFESSWWLQPGPKDQAIEFSLGLTAAGYYESLLDIVERPESMRLDPLTVKRVLSLIETTSETAVGVG